WRGGPRHQLLFRVVIDVIGLVQCDSGDLGRYQESLHDRGKGGFGHELSGSEELTQDLDRHREVRSKGVGSNLRMVSVTPVARSAVRPVLEQHVAEFVSERAA